MNRVSRAHALTSHVYIDYASTGLPLTNSHNTRAAKLTFHIPHGGALHGLAGYFEAVLYGNVGLSIHPQRMDKISKDMLSWFPLFFPFKVRHHNGSRPTSDVSLIPFTGAVIPSEQE